MATFHIRPGESHEHSHSAVTTTQLISGTADLILNGQRMGLKQDEPVSVPAHTPHVMVNTGSDEAVIGCWC